MPDSLRAYRGRRRAEQPAAVTAAARLFTEYQNPGTRSLLNTTAYEDELWSFYDTLGEFGAFVDWMARAMSRVRLVAAEEVPGDEPAPLTSGPAADLVGDFYGGTAGQAAFMEAIVPQLLVPGQGFLLPERWSPEVPLMLADWSVQSTKTFRETTARGAEVQIAPGEWRTLLPDALPVRIWVPNPQFPYLARSPAFAALPIMRTIDLINKRIIAELLSRLVMNGILWVPSEGQLPVSPAYADQEDGFWAELLDIAGKNMRNHGSALAAIPMPVRFPAEFIEKIKHQKWSEPFDEQLLAERAAELARLAKSLPLSAERQEGFADANHWNGFLVNEDDVKISIAPLAEIIAAGATTGFLQPMLAVAGEPLVGPGGGRLLMWPDYAELNAQPDNREAFRELYDRGEVSGVALRRESGASESDKPTPEEQREMILLKSVRASDTFAPSFELLTGETPPAVETPAAGSAVGPVGVPTSPGSAPLTPAAGSAPPPRPATPAPDETLTASVDRELERIAGWRLNGTTLR